MSNGNGFREFAQRLRNLGFVDTGNDPPYFPPMTGDYKKDLSSGEIRHIPGIISFVKPVKNPLIQVDLCKFSNGNFSVRVIMRGEWWRSFAVVIFDSNGNPQNKERARELEALLV